MFQKPITNWFQSKQTDVNCHEHGELREHNTSVLDSLNANMTDFVPQEGDDSLICFTDGSSLNNGKANSKSGYSVHFPYRNIQISETIHGDNPTNNRAELKGILRSYLEANKIDPDRLKKLIVYTDSMLAVRTFNEWLPGWKRNNWIKPDKNNVKNVDLLKLIDTEQSKRPHEYRHVRAHTGKKDWISVQNDIADKLAQDAARKN